MIYQIPKASCCFGLENYLLLTQMSSDEAKKAPEIGSIGWFDLTVPSTESVRDFYTNVAGWTYDSLPMDGGKYSDYVMKTSAGRPITGICHPLGENAAIPPQWLLYITVADVDASLKDVIALGGSEIKPVAVMEGSGRFCIIRDPAGAICALYQPL